jgi:NADH-quinone oxidoreductase subunit C
MPKTLDFLFTPVDPPKGTESANPHAKDSTNVSDIAEALRVEFGDAITDVTLYANEHTIYVQTDRIVDVCAFLKSEQGFDYLSDLGGIDRFTEEDRFEVFYNLMAIDRGKRLRLKVRVEEDKAVVPSIVSVHQSADWNERECWDMLGIHFDGHPDMRRVYLPEDFEHFPLRKEFPSLGIPGSLPLPSQVDDGKLVDDPYPAAHGSKPRRRTPTGE